MSQKQTEAIETKLSVYCSQCQYRVSHIPKKELQTYVNKVCPSCNNSVLLTKKEYKNMMKLVRLNSFFNFICKPFSKWLLDAEHPKESKVTFVDDTVDIQR